MELILAEKPSAARNFAKALGGKTGSYAGTEYKITNLRGHVMGLLPPDRQVPADKADFYKSWELENLPWDLDDFAWKKGILSGCKDIISGLKDELKGADCVVIATDVDPSGEGELLAWEALEKCGWNGPTKRMYFADEAPASVQKAFRERKTLPSMDKDGDYVKAVVRERWDLASMQFTRAATLVARKKGFRTVVRQGRLKSVMVKLTGDQLKAYNEYVRKPFYEARFKDENGNIFARKTDDPVDIRFDSPDKVDLSQLHDSAVVEDSRAKKHTVPGKLLDLAGLSAILAKQGFKPANVLKTYQEMYENQIVSYPRTEDKEVTPEQFGELLPFVDKIAGVVGVDTSLLSHRTARKTHVKEGGAHGANRPGINVPESLAGLEKGYGKIGSAIYSVLAKNYLAMLAEDYRTYRNASPLSMIYFSVTASPAEAESPFRGQGKPTAALRRKRVNWSNDDALCHLVRRHTEPDDDELGRGRLLTALNQLSLQPKQVCRCLGNLGASEFYFHGNPSSITLVNHGIDFEIVGVMIMGYRRVICGGIDLEIVQNKGFEK